MGSTLDNLINAADVGRLIAVGGNDRAVGGMSAPSGSRQH